MDTKEFDRNVEELTPRQRQVLKLFLQGQADGEIARALHLESSTVRRHLANVCKQFNLTNTTGEHYSYREELLLLFAAQKPVEPQSKPPSEFPGNPLPLSSLFYVPRPPIEERCLEAVAQPGALIRIRAPRRLGKTSLLNRTLAQARTAGETAISLNFGRVDPTLLTDLDKFLRWFCLSLSQKLGLSPLLEDCWDEQFGSLISCTTYVQMLLQKLDGNLVLGLDEIDWLLDVPNTARGFFALLRSWHEEANSLEVWQKLRLIVVHSTEVYIPLNLHQSPFNVGLPLRLPMLVPEQGLGLARTYGISVSETELKQLHDLVGGHPYLLQLAFYQLQQGDVTIASLLQTAATQSGIYSPYLRRLWQTLKGRPELLEMLQRVLAAEVVLDPAIAYQLESMGLVKLQGNMASVSCELYQQYFRALL